VFGEGVDTNEGVKVYGGEMNQRAWNPIHTPFLAAEGGEEPHDQRSEISGDSEFLENLFKRLSPLSQSMAPVLITGETGTGKEVIARTIHEIGLRREGPFVAVNCTAVPEELFESQFFGHCKGAFTGAGSHFKGFFEAASDGTLFLDEVGELPPRLQGKLLRVLQEGRVRPLGGTEEISVSPRILSATQVDIAKAIEAGTFRRDLFFRLQTLSLHLPPLRERTHEIREIILKKLTAIHSHNSSKKVNLTESALTLLEKAPWPGNFRELNSLLYSLHLKHAGQIITEEEVRVALRPQLKKIPVPSTLGYRSLVKKFERNLVLDTLASERWQKGLAAKRLKIPLSSLNSILDRLEIREVAEKKHGQL
jgi:two-component system response regulator PilR (NtrC family)